MNDTLANFNHMFRYMNEITRISLLGINFNSDHPSPEYALQIEVEFNANRNDRADKWMFEYYGESHPASQELINLLTLFLDTQAKEILAYFEQVHQKVLSLQEIVSSAKMNLAVKSRCSNMEIQPEKAPSDRDPYLEDLEEMITILVLMAQTLGKTEEFDPDALTDALRNLLKSCQWKVPILTE